MKLSGQILANIDPEIFRQLREITPRVAKKDVNVWVNDSEENLHCGIQARTTAAR